MGDNELYPFRRHLRGCQYFGPGGRDVRLNKCRCPFHVDGKHCGQRVRQSLKTRSHQLAEKRLRDLIQKLDAQFRDRQLTPIAGGRAPVAAPHRMISEAIERFLAGYGKVDSDGAFRGDREYSTFRKYRNSLQCFDAYCKANRIVNLNDDLCIDQLEGYRATRKISAYTWRTERQALITFFGFCIKRRWITANPAKDLIAPRNLKPNEIVPYTFLEESRILAACDEIGNGASDLAGGLYERMRARAMVMLLRSTALRISDVAALRKDAVLWDQETSTWRILLRTQKTGQPVFLPIPSEVKSVLDALPAPRNAAQDCPYYFWNGVTSRRALVGIAERTLSAVFKKSGVKDAHAHRFRHTLATRLLAIPGTTTEEVADILGNSPDVVRKHYGKWSRGRQNNIDRLMIAHFQTASFTVPVTKKSHEETVAVN